VDQSNVELIAVGEGDGVVDGAGTVRGAVDTYNDCLRVGSGHVLASCCGTRIQPSHLLSGVGRPAGSFVRR
jgi:hypothetical protein